mgnify:CR=1 FL=1
MASWETIKTRISKVTNKVVSKTEEVADTASKHVKLKTIEGNLSEKYELLGRLAYKHIKGVEVPEEKVNALTSEIAALISEKKHIKAEIEAAGGSTNGATEIGGYLYYVDENGETVTGPETIEERSVKRTVKFAKE